MTHLIEPTRFDGSPGVDPGDETVVILQGKSGQPVPMVFCWIPKPTEPFQLGSPETEADRESDETAHFVMLTEGYWLAKHPCSQKQYQAVTGKDPSDFGSIEDGPVDSVSWHDAVKFCDSVSEAGLLPEGWRLALPTEAQWEFACRAGGAFKEPFGVGDGRNLSSQQANFDGDRPYGETVEWIGRRTTTPGGSFPPNAWGLCDMHGQLWEWCFDWRGDYAAGTKNRPVHDPRGPSEGAERVLRGGSWCDDGWYARSGQRYGFDPAAALHYFGFRLSLVSSGRDQ